MKKYILKYGLFSAILVVGIPAIFEVVMGNDASTFALSEVIGYLAILSALSSIFIANRKYQTEFGPAGFKLLLWLGSGVASITSLAFGLYNVIYVIYIDTSFQERYFSYSIDKIKNSGIDSQLIEQQVSQLESQKELFFDPMFNFLIMFFTVFVLGFILSLLAAWFQKNKLN